MGSFSLPQWLTTWVLVFPFSVPSPSTAHQGVPGPVFSQRLSLRFSLVQQRAFNNCSSTRLLPPAKVFRQPRRPVAYFARVPAIGLRLARRRLFSFCFYLACEARYLDPKKTALQILTACQHLLRVGCCSVFRVYSFELHFSTDC